LRICVTV